MAEETIYARSEPLGLLDPKKLGAWPYGAYRLGLKGSPGTVLDLGIHGAKLELIFNGFDVGIDLEQHAFGPASVNRTVDAQRHFKIGADGELGPTTARFLVRKRVYGVENDRPIPDHWLMKLIGLESGYGFGAISPDLDRGLGQINSIVFDQITDAQAFDPGYAVPWIGDRLAGAYDRLRDWEAAVFAHNAPALADDWLNAGKPATGGRIIHVGTTEYPLYEWATLYVNAVKKQLV